MIFSIVIPTYKNLKELKKCLHSLERQSFTEFEVLVCIDGQGKDIVDWFNKSLFPFAVKLLHHSEFAHRGRAATRNLALPHLKGTFTLFLDSDMETDPEMLKRHFEILQKGNSISIGSVSYKNSGQNMWVRYIAERGIGKFHQGDEVPFQYFIAPNTALLSLWWKEIGGFDEEISHYGGEDMELGYRINEKFHPQFLCNEVSIVTTTQPKNLDEAILQLKEYGATGLRHIVKKFPMLKSIYWVGKCESEKFSDKLFEFLTIRPFRNLARFLVRITPFFIQKFLINYLVIATIHEGYRSQKY